MADAPPPAGRGRVAPNDAWSSLVNLVSSSPAFVWTAFPRLKSPEEFAGGGEARVQTQLRATMHAWTHAPLHASLLLAPNKRCAKVFEATAVKLHRSILQLTGDMSSKDSIADNLRIIHDLLHASTEHADDSVPPVETVVEEYMVQLMKHLTGNARIESEIIAWKLMCAALTSVHISHLKIFQSVVRFVLDERSRLEGVLRSGAEATFRSLSPYVSYAIRALEVFQLQYAAGTQEAIPAEHILAQLVFDPILVDILYPDGSVLLRHVPLKPTHTPSEFCALALWYAGLSEDELAVRDDGWRIHQRAVIPCEGNRESPLDTVAGVDARSAGSSQEGVGAGNGSIFSSALQAGDRVNALRMARGILMTGEGRSGASEASSVRGHASVADSYGGALDAAPGRLRSNDAPAAGANLPEAVICAPAANIAFPVDKFLHPNRLMMLQLHGINLSEAAAGFAKFITTGEPPKVTITSILSYVRRHKLTGGFASRLVSSAPIALVLRRRVYVHSLTPPVYTLAEPLDRAIALATTAAGGDAAAEGIRSPAAAATTPASAMATGPVPTGAASMPVQVLAFRGRHLELALDEAWVTSMLRAAAGRSTGNESGDAPAPAHPGGIAARTPKSIGSTRSLSSLARAASSWRLGSSAPQNTSGSTNPAALASSSPTAAASTKLGATTVQLCARRRLELLRPEGSPIALYSIRERALMLAQITSDLQSGLLTFPLPSTHASHDPRHWSPELDSAMLRTVKSLGSPARDAILALVSLAAAGRKDVMESAARGDILDELAPSFYDAAGAETLQHQVQAVLADSGIQDSLLRSGLAATSRESWLHDVVLAAVHDSPLCCAHPYVVEMHAEVRWPTASPSAGDVDLAAQSVCVNQIKYGIQRAAHSYMHDPTAAAAARRIKVGGQIVVLPPTLPGTAVGGGPHPRPLLLMVSAYGVSLAAMQPSRAQTQTGLIGAVGSPTAMSPPLSILHSVPFSHCRWHVEGDAALILEVFETCKPGGETEIRANPDLPLYTLVLSPSQPAPAVPRPTARDLADTLDDTCAAWRAQAPQCAVRMLPDPASDSAAADNAVAIDPLTSKGAHVAVPWRPSFVSRRTPQTSPNDAEAMVTTPARIALDFCGKGLRLGMDGVGAPGATEERVFSVPATPRTPARAGTTLPASSSQSAGWFSSRNLSSRPTSPARGGP